MKPWDRISHLHLLKIKSNSIRAVVYLLGKKKKDCGRGNDLEPRTEVPNRYVGIIH